MLPLVAALVAATALPVLGVKHGAPMRLLHGVDYELNTCGIDNGAWRPY